MDKSSSAGEFRVEPDSQWGGTPREKFIAALERRPITGRVPHFELVFFLTMEAFGKVHPSHRSYYQWDQMSAKERELQLRDQADIYIATAERYRHDAIFIHPNPDRVEPTLRLVEIIREKSGDRYFLMRHGDATTGIPDGNAMEAYCYRLIDEPEKVKAECAERIDRALEDGEKYAAHGGLDGFALCSDYCLNDGPFLSPNLFEEFIAPYLSKLVAGYRAQGFYTIKHTDGDIMPILDQLIQCKPHALHSIDPQAGVDIAVVKRLYGDKVCLIGNVNCGLLQTGTEEQAIESARYALKSGMPGGGYIFSTSNCVYTGMDLSRYELILRTWVEEGIYTVAG